MPYLIFESKALKTQMTQQAVDNQPGTKHSLVCLVGHQNVIVNSVEVWWGGHAGPKVFNPKTKKSKQAGSRKIQKKIMNATMAKNHDVLTVTEKDHGTFTQS